MNGNSIRTFLGSNSEHGFYSLYPQFPGKAETYVIKGGPGSGKSGLMKKAAAAAAEQGHFVEYCYCSSDAGSLDAVRIPEKNICILDGTPPHTFEPRFPGAQDVILNTGLFWDRKKLRKNREEIEILSHRIQTEFARTYRYLSAAGQSATEEHVTAEKGTNRKKMSDFVRNLLRRHGTPVCGEGTIHPRFLSSISPQGYITNKDTLYTLCDRVFVLNDKYGVSDLFLDAAAEYAQKTGAEVYAFFDPLQPDRLRHIALPEINLAFATSNRLHTFEPQNAYRIDLKRFTDLSEEDLVRCKKAEKVKDECLSEALAALSREKALHDDLEEYYIDAMDFRKLNQYTNKVIKEILA